MLYPVEESLPSSNQTRINELEKNLERKLSDVRIKDLLKILQHHGIPKEELDGIEDFSTLFLRMNSHENEEYKKIFHQTKIEYLQKGIPTSLKVLKNISKTRNSARELLVGDIQNDPAFLALNEIQEAIGENPGALEGYEVGVKEMGKTWAIMFIEDWKQMFISRNTLCEMYDGDFVASDMSLQDQYILLTRIHQADKVTKDYIIKEICKILPSVPGKTFTWENIKEIVCDLRNN